MIHAVLFDVDGTLLDTSEFIFQAFESALLPHNVPLDRKELGKLMGKGLQEIYTILAPAIESSILIAAHRDFQKKNLHLAQPFPGVIETLQALKKKQMKLAAVTTRSKVTSIVSLEQASIYNYFDIVISGEDAEHIKPHPAPVLKAIDMLGVDASEAIMVGDTYADVEAGKAAGTKTVGVSYGFHGSAVAANNPDYLIHSLKELLSIIK